MLDVILFGDELKKWGFNLFTGVPCSLLKELVNYAIDKCNYIAASNEGDAVSIAAGAYIGGDKSVVIMQNSGLTNATSPLISLNYPFKIPSFGFISLRGEEGISDAPQHELIGKITTDMLKIMGIKYEYLSKDFKKAKEQLKRANEDFENGRSFFFIVRKNTFKGNIICDEEQVANRNLLIKNKSGFDELPSRYETLKVINSIKDKKTVQLVTTGKSGRELYEIEDANNNFYMVGSMGCVSSIGLGLALSKEEKDIVIIDGDGSLLMRMGSLATNGYYSPSNMLHILLDNGSYDSTGGQSTVSSNIDFAQIAASCGYKRAIYVHNLLELEDSIRYWKKNKGLTFICIKISKGSKNNLGRPHLKPYEIKDRLKVFIND